MSDLDEIRGDIAADLKERGWTVEAEPVLGSVRPDILISEDDRVYVVEVVAGDDGVHFGSVAQAAAFGEAARNATHRDVEAVLVVTGPMSEEIGRVGNDFGVEVLSSESADPTAISDLLTNRLSSKAPQP
jgi:hypothetical protein